MEFNLDHLLAQAREVTPTREQWFVPTQAPAVDPFAKPQESLREPWLGFHPPSDQPVTLGPWLRALATDVEGRIRTGVEYLYREDLTQAQRDGANRRLSQLNWQANLLGEVVKYYVPCLACSKRIGGSYQGDDPAVAEARAWSFQEHFTESELPVTTPAGNQVVLVPWPTGRSDRRELAPDDLAALARVGRLAGLDELQVLDAILTRKEPTP